MTATRWGRPDGGRSRRTVCATAVLLALLLGLLTGCSEEGPDYCGTLADEKKTLTDLASRAGARQGDVITPTLESFERLRADAPEQLVDEWDTLLFAYRALADAVEAAGVDPAQYRPGRRPPGMSAADARTLATVASKLQSPRVLDAVAGIEDHAQQVCKVDFRG